METEGLTVPESENSITKVTPNIATHKKPKIYVMIFDLPQTARTRQKNSSDVEHIPRIEKLPCTQKRAWQCWTEATNPDVSISVAICDAM